MNNRKYVDNIVIEHAHTFFRNFEGRGGEYNREGDRNFRVRIDDPDLAQKLIEDGWNIRVDPPRDPDGEPRYSLKVAVSYKFREPDIRMISNKSIRHLTADTVKDLDRARIEDCGVNISPSFWEINGKKGIKAYLESAYFKLEANPFEDIYAEYEDDESTELPV